MVYFSWCFISLISLAISFIHCHNLLSGSGKTHTSIPTLLILYSWLQIFLQIAPEKFQNHSLWIKGLKREPLLKYIDYIAYIIYHSNIFFWRVNIREFSRNVRWVKPNIFVLFSLKIDHYTINNRFPLC